MYPIPNSGIDGVSLADGRVVLCYKHADRGPTPLNLAVSGDGEHFDMFHVLEAEPGEYSSPAMVVAADGDLLIAYPWRRENIRFVRLPHAAIPGSNSGSNSGSNPESIPEARQ